MVVKGAHILWDQTQIDIVDDRDAAERRKFRNAHNLLSVEKIESKSQRKFQFCLGSHVYIWKAATEKKRNQWVSGLRQKKEMITAFHAFLEE